MWVDVKQNTEEWFQLRKGLITSSKFSVVMANTIKKNGEFNPNAALSAPANKYAQEKALERVSGKLKEEKYQNSYMDNGHIYEPIACELYEIEKVCEVTNGGFNYLGWIGDSPDGNVGKKGCIEIKCVISNTQWERIKKGGYDLTYKWQIQGHLWLGQKEWCDFVSYCYSPEMVEHKRLYIYRVYRNEKMISMLTQRLNYFNKQINKNIKFLNKENFN